MTTQKLFAVRDVKAEAFAAPMAVPTEGLARRAFTDAVMQPGSVLAKNAEDYMLFQIGEYDPNSGLLVACSPSPKFVMAASDVLNSARIAREKHEPVLPLETPKELAAKDGVRYEEVAA